VIRKALEEGNFSVNGRPGKKEDRLSAKDILTFTGHPDILEKAPLPGERARVPIHYEDESILVVNKPAGMATHGFSGRERDTLANFLVAIRPGLCGVGRNRWEPGIVHRLDRDTSGLLLVAKDQGSFENLRAQFHRREVRKQYWALVWGKTKNRGEVRYALSHDSTNRKKMRVMTEGKTGLTRERRWRAVTRFQTLSQSEDFSFLRVEIETGVTHQIRAHMQAIGHPLVGDPFYGDDRPDPFGLGRQFLHAYYLRLHHPRTGKEVTFEAALPPDLRKILNRLGISI
jgi:23S rRNA pseudouridine1911/1915/1917 synthase